MLDRFAPDLVDKVNSLLAHAHAKTYSSFQ